MVSSLFVPYLRDMYLALSIDTFRQACARVEENGVGLGFRSLFSLANISLVTSRSMASASCSAC